MGRLETYKTISKKVNRYIKMIDYCATLHQNLNAEWYYVRIMDILTNYYKYGKISFQAKALFINRIIYNTNWMDLDK